MTDLPLIAFAVFSPLLPALGHWARVNRILLFSLLSLGLFYLASTWTPDQLTQTGGLSQVATGNALTIFHLLGIVGTLLVPLLVRGLGCAHWLAVAIALGWIVYFTRLFVLPQAWMVWSVVGGVVQGAGIGLAGLTGSWLAPTAAMLLCAVVMAVAAPRAASADPIG